MNHRIFVPVVETDTVVTGEEFHHAARVVRLREGEEVELFDLAGRSAAGVVTTIEKTSLSVRIERELPSREAPVPIHLAMAIINLDKFELVLQKATELGAASLIPLVTDRVEIRKERYAGKMERWNRVVFEAVKQSGRSRIPPVAEPTPFREVICRSGVRVLFDGDTEPDAEPVTGEATLLIGPEGGWTGDEIELARSEGARFARLGPRRLRAETAGIAALTTLSFRTGNL